MVVPTIRYRSESHDSELDTSHGNINLVIGPYLFVFSYFRSYTCIVSPLLSCILVRERRLTVEAKTYSCTEIVLFYHFELLRLIRYRM